MKLLKTIWMAILPILISYQSISQTQIPNAGFEDWNNQTSLKGWETTNKFGEIFGFTPVTKSEDKHSGKFAICLSTCNTYGGPAMPGVACLGSLGIYEVSGGIAITGRPVKLKGYMKHPSEGDTVSVSVLLLKKANDSVIKIASGTIHVTDKLNNYSYFECPVKYYIDETPDLLNIVLMTSDKVGSTLIIDDLELDYTMTGMDSDKNTGLILSPTVYPNPANSTINIRFGNVCQRQIKIYDSNLNEINSINASMELYSFDLKDFAMGSYYYEIRENNKVISGKFILNK
jgi:hypothetical protein